MLASAQIQYAAVRRKACGFVSYWGCVVVSVHSLHADNAADATQYLCNTCRYKELVVWLLAASSDQLLDQMCLASLGALGSVTYAVSVLLSSSGHVVGLA